MCGVCGCGQTDNLAEDQQHDSHLITIEQDLMAKNKAYAEDNRQYFLQHNIFAINLVSSPGSGKTTLLERTISALKPSASITVIEGDQQTDFDAQKIKALDIPVLQINTGKGCHLDAHQIGHAVMDLKPAANSYLFIENVGNLVCPALFDLGEAHKVVILSVTEGDDKPLKYPDMFREADLMLVNKMDLLPHVQFNVDKTIQYAKQINPQIQALEITAIEDTGLKAWLQWLQEQYNLATAASAA